ncbi:MAG: DUF1993 domain-containing protein [Rhodospirillaceae bacterium]|nr:MAG: DUF1993 domain-containing protein [Rhodospirillaceae bacterium]
MTVSMYQISIPGIVRILNSISGIIDKAVAHCEARKIDPAVMINFRLAADMLPFSKQIQIMTDQAKGMAGRLAGVEIPKYADTETTFAELKARIARTVDYLNSFKPAQIDGSEDKEIVLKAGLDMKFKGLAYMTTFANPNIYFHAATAYDILRHLGVELGKRDFLANMDGQMT